MKKLFSVLLTITFLASFSSISLAESFVMHTVDAGDTFWNISSTYQQDLNKLLAINQTSDPSLMVGDFIKIKSLNKNIDITVNGTKLYPDSSPYLENNRTFVPIRFIAEALNADITWNSSTSTAIITDGNKTISLPVGSKTALVNDSSYILDAPIKNYNGRVYIPVRFVSEILDCTVSWDQQNYIVKITNDNAPLQNTATYTEEDLLWLSRIIYAESIGESFEGKLAVANVILNRKDSTQFPNTIKEVIFDRFGGTQFTPVANGTIYNTPTPECEAAAVEALEGNNNIGNSLFFVNSSKSILNWIQTNRTFYKTIGNHDFYL